MSDRLQFAAMLEAAHQRAECGSPPLPQVAELWLKDVQDDARLSGLAYDILGHAHQHLSTHRKAQRAFSAARQCYQQAGLLKPATSSLVLLGTSHLLSGEPLLALDHWSDALQIARSLNDIGLCVKVYLGISQVYIGFGDCTTSLRYNELALKIAAMDNDGVLQCEAQLFVASDFYRLMRYEEALVAIAVAEALMASTPIHNKVWAAEIVYYRGCIHAAQNHLLQAKLELETAYTLSVQNENLWGSAHALTALAEVVYQLHEDEAESVLLAAVELAKSGNLVLLQRRCCLALTKLYIAKKMPEQAVPFYPALFTERIEVAFSVSASQRKQIVYLEALSRISHLKDDLA